MVDGGSELKKRDSMGVWRDEGLNLIDLIKRVAVRRKFTSSTFLARCVEVECICKSEDMVAMGLLSTKIGERLRPFFGDSFDAGFYQNCIWLYLVEEIFDGCEHTTPRTRYVYQM